MTSERSLESLAPDDVSEPSLDRTISPVAGRLTPGRRGRIVAFTGLLAGCGVFALASWSADRPKPEKAPQRPARQVVAFEPAALPPTLANPGANAPTLAIASADASQVPALTGSGASAPPSTRPAKIEARSAPIMAYSRGGLTAGAMPAAAARVPALGGEGDAPTELDQLRRGSRIGQATARTLGDRNFLILAGTTIPCILQAALDTSTAGYVTCLIGREVYSDNGAVVLLDKGTRVLGEYRAGLRQGQRRVFILWTRAVTPTGVAIDLASPAVDALGRSGFDGEVDTHFWDRFGAALLLSVVDEGAHDLAGQDARSATARLPSDAAGIAVQSGVNIPSTLRKAQGVEVAIQAAQDFDFSRVYALRARQP